MSKPVILSGIQPSGELHVGNYLGSLKNFVTLQNSGQYDCYFFVADYHAMTENYEPDALRQRTLGLLADYLAAGLDPKKSTLFIQSLVPGHTELAWIFNTITPVTELFRMTQYKDKAGRQDKNINTGLLDYPVLMAADILLYRPLVVPVGQDQVQHLEIARDIVRWFNARFGEYFREPKPVLTRAPKVMSLLDPTKKMSKSLGPNHYIRISDEPEVITKKLQRAVSDGGDVSSPGGQNLFLLLEEFAEPEVVAFFAKQRAAKAVKFGELKKALATSIAEYFTPFREKRSELLKDVRGLERLAVKGSAKAAKVAAKTIAEVRQLVGLIK
ncbi:MAG: tryptophan--tRNA ligase [Patescibacteria group bacterium]